MYVDLPNHGRCKLGVKYHYRDHWQNSNGLGKIKEPYATSVYLTTETGDKFEGYAAVQGPDHFSRLEGRKWGLVSLTKRDTDYKLSPEDRECLFKALCPKFFGLSRKERKEQKCEQKNTEPMVVYKTLTVYKNDFGSSVMLVILGFCLAMIFTSIVTISQ